MHKLGIDRRVLTSGSLRTMDFRAKNLCINTIAVPGTLAGLQKARVIVCGMSMARDISRSQVIDTTSLASASVPYEQALASSRRAEQTVKWM